MQPAAREGTVRLETALFAAAVFAAACLIFGIQPLVADLERDRRAAGIARGLS